MARAMSSRSARNISVLALLLSMMSLALQMWPNIARGVTSVVDDAATAEQPAVRVGPIGGEPTTVPTTIPHPELTYGFDATPPSVEWQRPDMLAPGVDPAYGTPVRRMSSADGTRFDRNTYSRRQAESADGSRFMTYHGSARYRVYDRSTGALIRELDIHPDAEPQWHPTDSDIVRHIAGSEVGVGDLAYFETDVSTGATRQIADLGNRIRDVFPSAAFLSDGAEGSSSIDGSRHSWMVFDTASQAIAIVSYDLALDAILGLVPIETEAVGPLDWVSMSPTGGYVIAGYWNATVAYDADLTNRRLINSKGDHSDIALDAAGADTYVYIDFSAGPDGGWLVAVDVATLERTRIFDLYAGANTSLHVSGKGYDLPGWVVVSTYNCKVPGAWSCDKVLAIELSGEQRIVNLAHTYNCGDDYWTETHAVVNRSFTRVYFNSDAGSCGIDAEVYELTLPPLG